MKRRKDEDNQSQSSTPCPICKTPVTDDVDTFPFCCARCRQIDLGKWLSGDYVISRPIEQDDLEEDD